MGGYYVYKEEVNINNIKCISSKLALLDVEVALNKVYLVKGY